MGPSKDPQPHADAMENPDWRNDAPERQENPCAGFDADHHMGDPRRGGDKNWQQHQQENQEASERAIRFRGTIRSRTAVAE